MLTDKAKLYRKQNKSVGFGFTDLEKKLIEQFNIPEQTLIDTADEVLVELKIKNKSNIIGFAKLISPPPQRKQVA